MGVIPTPSPSCELVDLQGSLTQLDRQVFELQAQAEKNFAGLSGEVEDLIAVGKGSGYGSLMVVSSR